MTSVAIVFILVTSGSAVAQTQPRQYYGGDGGEIAGYVLGVNKEPVDWAAVYANNGQQRFQAFSGMSGYYEMRVPAATYNVTVDVPGYEVLLNNANVTKGSTTTMNFNLNTMQVAVSSGSSSVINFYLEQTQTPVPEFQPTMTLLVAVLTIAFSTLLLKRLKK